MRGTMGADAGGSDSSFFLLALIFQSRKEEKRKGKKTMRDVQDQALASDKAHIQRAPSVLFCYSGLVFIFFSRLLCALSAPAIGFLVSHHSKHFGFVSFSTTLGPYTYSTMRLRIFWFDFSSSSRSRDIKNSENGTFIIVVITLLIFV